MRSDCVQAITNAAAKVGRTLTQKDLAGIEGRIKQALRDNAREDINAYRAMTPAEQLAAAADRAAKDIQFEYQRAAANVARQIVKHDVNQQFVDAMALKGMRRIEAVTHILQSFLTGKGGFKTLEQNVEGVVRSAKAKMEPIAAVSQKYGGFWTNKAMLRDIVRELYGQDTKNGAAREAAMIWEGQIAEPLRKQFNELGGAIRKLQGWAVPQDHSMWKVKAAGLENWVNYIRDRLDRSQYVREDGQYMSDTEMNAMLGDVWNTITTDGASDLTGQVKTSSSVKNRGQDRRVLHFKDADSFLDYNAKFADRSLLETMNSHIESMGKSIGALQTFGPNSEAGLRALLDDAVKRDTAAGMDRNDANVAREKAELSFALASGKMGAMGDPRVAHRYQIARSFLSAARLGSASLSAITDSANGMAVARAWNMNPYAAWAQWSSKAWTSKEFRQFMRSQGVGVEAITHAMSRYGEEVFGHGFTNNLANTVFRVSGLNFIDNVRRTATGAMLFDRIGQLARQHETLDAAHPADVARLRDAGVDEKTWQIWREASLGHDEMLTPAAIARLTDAQLAHIGTPAKAAVPYIAAVEAKPAKTTIDEKTGRITVRDRVLAQPGQKAQAAVPFKKANPEQLRRDAMQALIGTVSRDIDTVVPMPTLKARTSTEYQLSGLRGKAGGELARSILQFKSFPIAMISNHWQRLQSMPTVGGKVLYASELIATSTMLGALSIQLKSMVAGNNPQDMTDPNSPLGVNWKFVGRAFVQGGATGLYGDMIAGLTAMTPYKMTLPDQLGPLASTMDETYKLARTAWESGNPDKKADLGGEVTRFVRGNTPFANIWWGKAAIDHMIFQRLQDYYSPGYAQRMQQRVQTFYNSGQWWKPSTAASPAQVLTSMQGVTSPQVPNIQSAVGRK